VAPKLVTQEANWPQTHPLQKVPLQFHALSQEDTNWVGTVGACSYGGLHYQTGFWLCPPDERITLLASQ
jgi:hypothetical protein